VTFLPGYGGCLLAEDNAGRWRAIVQLFPDLDSGSNRLYVVGVQLSVQVPEGSTRKGPPRLDVAAWRSFPLAKAETVANLPDYFAPILEFWLPDEGPQLSWGEPIPDWIVSHFRKPKLPSRPAKGRYPDRFYEQAAALYRYWVGRGEPPAQRIAEEAGVPVGTVHRWIRETRRRGFLGPAGAKGRAG
jgi:hypothetical protein